MDDALRDSLMVEVGDLFAKDEIFEEGGAAAAGSERILIIGDGEALIGGQDGAVFGGLLMGFAALGRVTEGMDIVRRILGLPTSPTAGGPDMAGQMLDRPVPILSARRAP